MFCLINIIGLGTCIKGLVQKNPCFTHPKGMLSVNNFLLSDDNRSYIKNSLLFKLIMTWGVFLFNSPKVVNKAHASILKCASHSSGWVNKERPPIANQWF